MLTWMMSLTHSQFQQQQQSNVEYSALLCLFISPLIQFAHMPLLLLQHFASRLMPVSLSKQIKTPPNNTDNGSNCVPAAAPELRVSLRLHRSASATIIQLVVRGKIDTRVPPSSVVALPRTSRCSILSVLLFHFSFPA